MNKWNSAERQGPMKKAKRIVVAGAVGSAVAAGGLVAGGVVLDSGGSKVEGAKVSANGLAGSSAGSSSGGLSTTEKEANTSSKAKTGTQKAGSCGGTVSALPFKWARAKSNCGVLGRKGFKLTYNYWIPGGTEQMATVQVWGYSKGVGHWYNAGTIKSSGQTSRISVPWGNVGATPKVQVKGFPSAVVSTVRFSH